MTDLNETAWLWAAKGAGAVAGSAVSLGYILPSGLREAALRFAMGVVWPGFRRYRRTEDRD